MFFMTIAKGSSWSLACVTSGNNNSWKMFNVYKSSFLSEAAKLHAQNVLKIYYWFV